MLIKYCHQALDNGNGIGIISSQAAVVLSYTRGKYNNSNSNSPSEADAMAT